MYTVCECAGSPPPCYSLADPLQSFVRTGPCILPKAHVDVEKSGTL